MNQLVILVMGLSGSGKTELSSELLRELKLEHRTLWLNADKVRESTKNKDFSLAGRLIQFKNVQQMIKSSEDEIVLCDLIAPLPILVEMISPDILVWMDTVSSSEYTDTDLLFEHPVDPTFVIKDWENRRIEEIILMAKDLLCK